MDTKEIWAQVASDIQYKIADQFDRKLPLQMDEIADIISQGLKKYSNGQIDYAKGQIGEVMNKVLGQFDDKAEWIDFLKRICKSLPGYWVELFAPDGFEASTMLLLTDGSVICQSYGGKSWKRLTPDEYGNYFDGTWKDIGKMNSDRLYYASAVLADGRVIVSGGEYSTAGDDTNITEIYDPLNDRWDQINPPGNWGKIGDAPCCVLADGKMLIGNINQPVTALFDPGVNGWNEVRPEKGSNSHEESWVLLPDGGVLTVQCNMDRQAEKYVPGTGWELAGTVPVDLVEKASKEIGAAILLTNGKAIFFGATGLTALYHSDTKQWSEGPKFPPKTDDDGAGITVGCKDSPSCLLTNGKVLISAGEVTGKKEDYGRATYFYEYDPDSNSINRIVDPGENNHEPSHGRMLLLPNGQVLYASGSDKIYVYTYCSWIDDTSWRPEILNLYPQIQPGETYRLDGKRLTGLSQAVGYGDDVSAATNYPLICVRNNETRHKRFCRTFNHSHRGVATGDLPQYTSFEAPADIEEGWSEIYVIANGIESKHLPVLISKSNGSGARKKLKKNLLHNRLPHLKINLPFLSNLNCC